MELEELVRRIPGFDASTHTEKIKHFAWYLLAVQGKERFSRDDVKKCYDRLDLAPTDIGIYLRRMVDRRPPEVLQDRGGYRLEARIRLALDKRYGEHETTLAISRLLADLPSKVPDLAERVFLQEVVSCYRVRAFRSAIVMAWNLAYDHFARWILADSARLNSFNNSIAKVYQKKAGLVIAKFDDFSQLKEFEVIDIAGNAGLISKNQKDILKEKLVKRNAAAHPSSVIVQEPQANDVIVDLVTNVVLALK